MKALALFLLLAALTLAPPPRAASAQPRDTSADENGAAMLVADDVRITADNNLVAEGNVEAMLGARRLEAHAVIYDREADKLTIKGPIRLHENDTTLILAGAAELDRDMRNGLLSGARVVLDNQLQLAAHEMRRIEARYSQLYKAAVTSCRVCETGRPPLWQIRARRVIHDQQERQLYFDDAQLRVLDTPIFYLPRLRLPDPTLERASGFLIPSLHNSTLLGFGLKVPYFIRIGDHKDLTLTPFWTNETRTLEFRYRQAFRNGRIEVTGAVADDDLGTRSRRAYVFADGEFDLPRDFRLTFDVEAVNDDTFLLDYDYSDKDRLDSEIAVARTRRDEHVRGALTHFHSLRPNEDNSTLPTIVADANYERRVFPQGPGGELFVSASAHSHFRSSDLVTDGPDFDSFADGRDVTRLSTSADWRRSWVLPGGVLGSFRTGVAIDSHRIRQAGGTSRSSATEITPTAAVKLRWPLMKSTARGTSHVIEPVLQFAWTGGSNPDIPNDESTRIEFDEGNLFALSRFSAPDRRERGTSGAIGLKWTRYGAGGGQSALAFGQVIREETPLEPRGGTSFTKSSGLQDRFSDMLVAGQVKTPGGMTLTARSVFDDGLDTTKAEARASWRNEKADIGATYIWLSNDPAEARPNTVSEWSFDGSYRLSRHWTGSAEWRYDAASDSSIRAGLGLTYTNECVDISLSASRRFTSSTILEPSTNISLTVGLRGFTAKTRDKSYVRTCRK
ncbi:LPS-assembly protein LptD [Roseovarius sp. SYSU LYC5161]|uniref:LPS-assembly protein LptD n=1 Tax=Roseovarius halophilus (ex Wu et al. 2025) TaxID=3376060 RepID=UPI00399B67A3